MALDVQTIVMTSSYVPYERPPQPYTLWTAIPRGLQSFLVSAALDAKALNDDAFLILQATLPPNFGYVLADQFLGIVQDLAANWDNTVNLNLQNFYRADVGISVGLTGNYPQEFPNTRQDTAGRAIRLVQPLPSFPLIGTPGTTGVFCQMSAWNNVDAATLAGTVDAYLSFWQFDLEQIRKYPINTPIPTHAR